MINTKSLWHLFVIDLFFGTNDHFDIRRQEWKPFYKEWLRSKSTWHRKSDFFVCCCFLEKKTVENRSSHFWIATKFRSVRHLNTICEPKGMSSCYDSGGQSADILVPVQSGVCCRGYQEWRYYKTLYQWKVAAWGTEYSLN